MKKNRLSDKCYYLSNRLALRSNVCKFYRAVTLMVFSAMQGYAIGRHDNVDLVVGFSVLCLLVIFWATWVLCRSLKEDIHDMEQYQIDALDYLAELKQKAGLVHEH